MQLACAIAYGDDEEIAWIAAVWQPGVQLEDLTYTALRFRSLNRKLAKELRETCPKAVADRINDINKNRAEAAESLLNGRQVLQIILDSFNLDDDLVGATTATQLCEMKWLGDENKSTFYRVWTQLVDGLRENQMTEKGLRGLLAD